VSTDEPRDEWAALRAGAGAETGPTPPSEDLPPARHPARNRGSHAAPPSVTRSLVKSLVVVAVVASGVALGQHWRGSGSASAGGPVALPTQSRLTSATPAPAPTPTVGQPRGTPTVEATHQGKPTGTPTAVVMVPLTVLNNSRIHNLASDTAKKFHAAGWPIADVGNFTGQVSETTVYFEPGNAKQRAAAHHLAEEFPKITRVAPRFAGLPGHGLTVVLTRYWKQ